MEEKIKSGKMTDKKSLKEVSSGTREVVKANECCKAICGPRGRMEKAFQCVYEHAAPYLKEVDFKPTDGNARKIPQLEASICEIFADCITEKVVRAPQDNKDGAYIYNGSYWEKCTVEDLSYMCQSMMEKFGVGAVYRINSPDIVAKEVIKRRYYNQGRFIPDSRLVVFPNGVLDIDKNKLLDFSPELQTSYVISDYEYDATADCPQFLRVLERALPDEQDRLVLQEAFGYLFFPDKRHEVITIMVGRGNDGKSTIIDAVSNAMGKDNITSYSLSHITNENGHAIANMVGKLGNICFESGALRMGNEALFKSYCSGEPMLARLLYKDGFLTTSYPASVVAVNELPSTTDHSDGFYRRALIIPFKHQIPADEVDPLLKGKLQAERSGILNWILQGYRRLMEQGKFTYSMNIEEAKEDYRSETDCVAGYMAESDFADYAARKARVSEMYTDFRRWASEMGYKDMNVRTFTSRLRLLGVKTYKATDGQIHVLEVEKKAVDDEEDGLPF